MRICLINPPTLIPAHEHAYASPPMGLLYVAAFLEQKNISFDFLDLLGIDLNLKSYDKDNRLMGVEEKDWSKYIQEYDLYCISSMFTLQIPLLKKFISFIRSKYSGKIVLGGAYPSIHPEEYLDIGADIVVMGEGEYTILELIQGKDPAQILGIAYKSRGQNFKNLRRPRITNLDSLPFPARHLVNMDAYATYQIIHAKKDTTRHASIITSRGCPFNCQFCSIRDVWGNRQWFARSPENVILELKTLKNEYNIQQVSFEDDNLTLNRDRAIKLFKLMIDNKLDISWATPNGVHIHTLDEELLILMKQAGLKWLTVAIESGDKYINHKVIKKNLDFEKVREIVNIARRNNIHITGFFILGVPGETIRTIKNTINFAVSLDLDYASFSPYTPYYGTPFYFICEEKGYIKEKSHNASIAKIDTESFTRKDVTHLMFYAHLKFHALKFLRHPILTIRDYKTYLGWFRLLRY